MVKPCELRIGGGPAAQIPCRDHGAPTPEQAPPETSHGSAPSKGATTAPRRDTCASALPTAAGAGPAPRGGVFPLAPGPPGRGRPGGGAGSGPPMGRGARLGVVAPRHGRRDLVLSDPAAPDAVRESLRL